MQDLINEINEVISIQALIPIVIIELLLMIVALISCLKSETRGPKWIWILVIIFIQIFGPIAYFVFGRKNE